MTGITPEQEPNAAFIFMSDVKRQDVHMITSHFLVKHAGIQRSKKPKPTERKCHRISGVGTYF